MQEYIVTIKADTTFVIRVDAGAVNVESMDWDNRSSECGLTFEVTNELGEPVQDIALWDRIFEAIPGSGGFKLNL